MRLITRFLAVVLIFAASTLFVSAAELGINPSGPLQSYNGGGEVDGFAFEATQAVEVSALGIFAGPSLSLPTGQSFSVGLWTSAGTLLASTDVTSADTAINSFYFHPITPVVLTVGQTYVVGAKMSGGLLTYFGGTYTMADGLAYVGNRWDSSSALVMPTSYDGSVNDPGYLGANVLVGTVNVAPAITNGPPPAGTVGTAYSFAFTSTGGPAPTFSVTAGNLPPGLTLSTDGVIGGSPTSTGTYVGTVTATNGVAPDATQNFSITIAPAPAAPVITSGALPNGVVGTAYSFTAVATGVPSASFSVTGSLPPGLSLASGTGVISGTPTTAGTLSGTLVAGNGVAPDATQNFSITIAPAPAAPVITSGALPNGVVGTAYSFTAAATGVPSASFSVTGSLPPGLSLASGTGIISGTPTTAGTFSGTLVATNGVAPDASQPFSITIAPAPTVPIITSASPPSGTVGEAYNFTVTTTGVPPPALSITGTLPPGLTFDSGSGVISGTPTAIGSFNVTITASNGNAPDAVQALTFSIFAASAAPALPVPMLSQWALMLLAVLVGSTMLSIGRRHSNP